MLKLYISKSKKRNNFCSCVHVLVKWLPQFLDDPLHPQQCPILSIKQIKHKLRQYGALDYLLWFPSKHRSDRETREDTADKYMLCITSHYKSGPVMKSRIDYIHRSLYRGVIKPLFPCLLLCDISILGAVVVTVSSRGDQWLIMVAGGRGEHWVTESAENRWSVQGRGNPGEDFGQFYCFGHLSAPLAGATEGLNYPVQTWHGYYYVGC